jgi:hypothetical protein
MTEPQFTLNELLTLGTILVRILREELGTVTFDPPVGVGECWDLYMDIARVELTGDEGALVERVLTS